MTLRSSVVGSSLVAAMLCATASPPRLWALQQGEPPGTGRWHIHTHTLRLAKRRLRIRRSNQSCAVTPVSYVPGAAFETESAMIGLSRGSRTTPLPGRVKYAMDQRSQCDCSSGGGLDDSVRTISQRKYEWGCVHNTMHIRAKDAAAEDYHRVAEIADRVARDGLRVYQQAL